MPAVAYAAGYTDDYGADTACSERELWLAVLRQAVDDLRGPAGRIRQDAANFFQGPDLLRVMDLAGIDRAIAPRLRVRAKELAEGVPPAPQKCGSVTYRGQTCTLVEWGRITGLKKQTIYLRLKQGWSAERALTLPLQKAGRRAAGTGELSPGPTTESAAA